MTRHLRPAWTVRDKATSRFIDRKACDTWTREDVFAWWRKTMHGNPDAITVECEDAA